MINIDRLFGVELRHIQYQDQAVTSLSSWRLQLNLCPWFSPRIIFRVGDKAG